MPELQECPTIAVRPRGKGNGPPIRPFFAIVSRYMCASFVCLILWSMSPMQFSWTNLVSAISAGLGMCVLALMMRGSHDPATLAAIAALQSLLSAAGFRWSADASLCCSQRRLSCECPLAPPSPASLPPGSRS